MGVANSVPNRYKKYAVLDMRDAIGTGTISINFNRENINQFKSFWQLTPNSQKLNMTTNTALLNKCVRIILLTLTTLKVK